MSKRRPANVLAVDWTDLARGIDALEAATTQAERKRLGGVFEAMLGPVPQAGLLVLALARWYAWGGPLDHVRVQLQVLASDAEHKMESVALGQAGGRSAGLDRSAKAKALHEQWITLYERALNDPKNRTKWTPHSYAKVIAEESGIDASGETKLKERTVRRVLAAHEASKKVAGREPPSRPIRPT